VNRATAEPPHLGTAGWKPSTAWIAVTVGVLPGLVVSRVIVRDGGDPRIWVALTLIVTTLVGLVVPIAAAGLHGRPSASDFGLRRPPLARATALLVGVLVATYALSAAWVVALGLDDDSENVLDRLSAGNTTLNAFLVVVLLAVATPLAEEFMFRGYFFRAMSNWRGVGPGVLIATVAFTATHVGWTPAGFLVPVAVFGLGLNLLYVWTGSLYPGLAMHAILNSVSAIAVLEGWRIPVAIVVSVVTTLLIARLIAGLLGGRPRVTG